MRLFSLLLPQSFQHFSSTVSVLQKWCLSTLSLFFHIVHRRGHDTVLWYACLGLWLSSKQSMQKRMYARCKIFLNRHAMSYNVTTSTSSTVLQHCCIFSRQLFTYWVKVVTAPKHDEMLTAQSIAIHSESTTLKGARLSVQRCAKSIFKSRTSAESWTQSTARGCRVLAMLYLLLHR